MTTFHRYAFWIVVTAGVLASGPVLAQGSTGGHLPVDATGDYRSIGLGCCAALTMALSVLGASFAVARIGSAAMGAAAEKPELLTRSIVFVALAEGLAVLGFAISIMLIQKI